MREISEKQFFLVMALAAPFQTLQPNGEGFHKIAFMILVFFFNKTKNMQHYYTYNCSLDNKRTHNQLAEVAHQGYIQNH